MAPRAGGIRDRHDSGVARLDRRDAGLVCEEPERQSQVSTPHPIFSARVDHDPDGIDARLILERIRSIKGVASAEVTITVPYLQRSVRAAMRRAIRRRRHQSAFVAARSAPNTSRRSDVRDARRARRSMRRRYRRERTGGDRQRRCWPASYGRRVEQLARVRAGQPGIRRGPARTVVGVVTGYSMTAIQPVRPMVFTPFAQLQRDPAPRRIHDARRRRCGAD